MDAPARSDASRRKLRTAAPSSRSTFGSAATTTTVQRTPRRRLGPSQLRVRGHGVARPRELGVRLDDGPRPPDPEARSRSASKAFLHGPAVSSSDSSADASEAWPVFASETWPPESRGSSMIARAVLWVLVLLLCVLCCVSSRFRASVCVLVSDVMREQLRPTYISQ